jgi:hypothetical protein
MATRQTPCIIQVCDYGVHIAGLDLCPFDKGAVFHPAIEEQRSTSDMKEIR